MNKPNEGRFLDDQKRLTQWPKKQQDQLLVLAYLMTKLDYATSYTESEINEMLKQWHTFSDWSLLRRELFDQGFVDRSSYGTNYRLKELTTDLAGLVLVRPNLAKDARIAVKWLVGSSGRETLRLMGKTDADNKPSSVAEEDERLRDFITSTKQDTWTIRYQDKTVGVVWINLDASKYLKAPSIHIMVGEPSVRGRGVGGAAIKTLINQLGRDGQYEYLYSRYLIDNLGSAKLLKGFGFIEDGKSYHDVDGLCFQNVRLSLKLHGIVEI
jgi:RimJ/RimL family protein N-acetyltransferase